MRVCSQRADHDTQQRASGEQRADSCGCNLHWRRVWTPFVQLHVFIFVLLLSVAISLWLRPLAFAADLELISLTGFAMIMFLSLYFVDNEYSENPPASGRSATPCPL